MIETILGALFGGAFRLAPEILRLLDRRGERAHERQMLAAQIEADKLRAQQRTGELAAAGQIVLDRAGLAALTEAIKGQAQRTGHRLVDALNFSVRPVATYVLLALYVGAKLGALWLALLASGSAAQALLAAYDEADRALLGGILNFWFLDRVIRYQRGQ